MARPSEAFKTKPFSPRCSQWPISLLGLPEFGSLAGSGAIRACNVINCLDCAGKARWKTCWVEIRGGKKEVGKPQSASQLRAQGRFEISGSGPGWLRLKTYFLPVC